LAQFACESIISQESKTPATFSQKDHLEMYQPVIARRNLLTPLQQKADSYFYPAKYGAQPIDEAVWKNLCRMGLELTLSSSKPRQHLLERLPLMRWLRTHWPRL